MAGIITNVGDDIRSLQQLRQEIENVKKTLGSIDINVKIDIRKDLEQKLQALTRQYDTLVSKAAEADAKLLESAKRIDKAVDAITASQERAAKPTDTTISKEQTTAVEGQAKAYLDLKDEIDSILGTREQNIRQLLNEQNAIRIINAEIAKINKSRQYGMGLTSAQVQRLQQLSDSLLTHKQAIAEVRQELNNNAKMGIAAVGSMNELSQSLSRMRAAYRALNEEERNSPFGQNLLKSIKDADTRIKELDAAIGNHQRNVGNYQGRFNGLNMSVQQIVRELPSATMGINMFFMAISNNVPIMADQIKYAKELNKEMKAAGNEPVPVWKQLVSSMFSWQTAMMVGITLLTVYGKDIANWVKSLFSANDAQEQAKKEAIEFSKIIKKSHDEWRNSVAQTASQQITSYRKMQREWESLGNNLDKKRKFVDSNKTAFNQLGFAVNSVSDAERVMSGNTDAVVQSIMARAKAAAYYAQMQAATERYIKQTEYNKGTLKGGGYYETIKAGKTFLSTGVVPKELQGLRKGIDYTTTFTNSVTQFELTAKGASKINAKRSHAANERLVTNQKKAKEQLDKQIKSLQGGLETVTKENKDLLKKIGVSEYKGYKDTNPVKNSKANLMNVDYNKLARERSDAERELADKSSQVYIDSLQNGYEKERKQRELNHKKELDDLEKYKRDFLQKKISDAKQLFEADPKNKGKKFNAASVTLTQDEQDKFDKMRSDTLKKHVNEDKEAEDERIRNARAAWQAYYHNFGTYAERRKALQEELNDKLAEIDRKSITESQKQAEKATLTKQYANQFDELDNSVKNSTTLMGQLFADASKKSISEIEDVIDKTQLLLSYLEAVKDENGNATINGKNVSRKDLLGLGISENALSNLEQDPTKIESIRSALDRLKGELGAKSPFELLKKEIKEAGKELNKGGKQNIANGIMAIADAVHSFLPSVKEFGNSLGTIFGDDLGDKIGRATDALDGLATTGKGVGQIMSGDIIGGTMSAINGISQVTNALDGMFGADYSHYNEMVERYNTLNSIWDSLIDKKLKYINTSYGMEAQMVADEAIKLANKSQESYRILGKERLNSGASVGSHSIGVRQRKKMSSEGWSELRNVTREIGLNYNSIAGGRMTGLFDLTAEQLSKLKDGAQTFWAQLDNDVRKYLDGIIDGDERIQEIQRKQKEQLTQISFDGLFDGFVDKLMDMKTSWTDFSKDASTIFMKAVLTNQIGIQFHKKLQEWYDKFAKSTEGGMTEDERKTLTDEYKGYVDEAIKMRDELAKTVGYDVASAEQSASANGVSSITYEQASNIVALTTAGNISRDQIKDVLLSQKLSSIDLSLTGISLIGKDTVSIADETRTILANSYMELKEINENTGVSAKCLTQIDENINSMNRLIKEKL